MKLQHHEENEEPEINLTSLIDVVFLLLIFFMVSTTFERQALLRLNLPEASTAESETVPEMVEFIVTDEGRLFVGDQELVDTRQATVQAAIAERFGENPEAVLVVRADGEAPHRLVVRVLDSAAAEGIRRVSIAAVEGESE
ncbi:MULTISPECIES: biopolymer transporter ExbD [unclassified Wenzhouxiangella]|uniref:ExbD/TolR family protein n=1 Tax=unclassified Wenzhouxiangella TaxID=2613841 RepID=UPI000E329047|nr:MULTISPECIES: biopolymer transporter ExbD [unclassified Wenzhouxiangella]RFF28236.1 biopolymer transporter ExbD [Wenzhouxiangella sp. 15181]RFP67911.1 biopolymer transporter ExbD [Wenzhouxiangella sp. 15190]